MDALKKLFGGNTRQFGMIFGLVALIAQGYRLLAWMFLAVYVLPLMTWGLWRLWSDRAQRAVAA